MSGSNLGTMTGDANCLDQPLRFGLNCRFQHATRTERDIPLDRIGQIVQLPEIDVVGLHAVKRSVQLFFRLFRFACPSFGRQEELRTIASQPGCNA